MSRAGLAPPLPRDGFLSPRRGNGQPPQISPSSVTCGDSFPQKGGSLSWSLPGRLPCWEDCNGRHICRPYKPTRKFFISIRSRAGHAPPLPRDGFLLPRRGNGQPSQISPSSVTCGDSFPQKGEAFRGVYPVGCLVERISRAAYMPPLQTNPQISIVTKPRAGLAPPLPGGEF